MLHLIVLFHFWLILPASCTTDPSPWSAKTIQIFILSRASETGSPTNRLGSDKTRGQGSLTIDKLDKIQFNHLDKNLKKERTAHLIPLFLLRQGEPGTSQYIEIHYPLVEIHYLHLHDLLH